MKKIAFVCLLLFLLVPRSFAGGCYSSYRSYTPSYTPSYLTAYPSQAFLYGKSYSYDYERVVLTPVYFNGVYGSPPPVNVTINQQTAQQAPAATQPQQVQPQTMPGAVGQSPGNAEILAALKSISDRLDKLENAAGR